GNPRQGFLGGWLLAVVARLRIRREAPRPLETPPPALAASTGRGRPAAVRLLRAPVTILCAAPRLRPRHGRPGPPGRRPHDGASRRIDCATRISPLRQGRSPRSPRGRAGRTAAWRSRSRRPVTLDED